MSPNGTQLTVVVPYDAMTGTVSVVGDELNTAALLQVVPVVTTAYMNGTGSAQLQGFGFIEGNGTIYSFDGSTRGGHQHQLGARRPLQLRQRLEHHERPGQPLASHLRQRGLDGDHRGRDQRTLRLGRHQPRPGRPVRRGERPELGALYVSTYNGNVIQQVNANTGAAIGSPLALPGGNSYGLTGLQVLPQAMTLGTTAVPAGSLLVTDGYANPDRVNAINSSTGAVVATLILHDNLDANAGVYDAATGDLYLLQGSTNKVAVVDPKTGLTLSQFATPAGVDYWHGGLALGPKQDALWLGSAASNVVYEVNKASGAVILSVDLTSQGVAGIAGLAFNAAGQLLVASTDGVVFVVNLTTQASSRCRRRMRRAWPRPHRPRR